VQATTFGNLLNAELMKAVKDLASELELAYAQRIYGSSNDVMAQVRKGTTPGYMGSNAKMGESLTNACLRFEILSMLRIRFPVQIDNSGGVKDGWKGEQYGWEEQGDVITELYMAVWLRHEHNLEGVLRSAPSYHASHLEESRSVDPSEGRWNFSEDFKFQLVDESLGFDPDYPEPEVFEPSFHARTEVPSVPSRDGRKSFYPRVEVPPIAPRVERSWMGYEEPDEVLVPGGKRSRAYASQPLSEQDLQATEMLSSTATQSANVLVVRNEVQMLNVMEKPQILEFRDAMYNQASSGRSGAQGILVRNSRMGRRLRRWSITSPSTAITVHPPWERGRSGRG
jgi:hypothetical protein